MIILYDLTGSSAETSMQTVSYLWEREERVCCRLRWGSGVSWLCKGRNS